ncbi:MAG TPA: type II toxin-antitoxin system VapC family toxin [Candidatus Saccharimonadia bacterium]|nr:type II toxin-antitoxin system VapC family toxin [Candidatus Saccharimonadia bacterium]
MRLLIDTQVFIWLINDDKRIGTKTLKFLNDSSNQINLSYFSLFEMKIKATIGKLEYDDSVVDDLQGMDIKLVMPTTDALKSYAVPNSANKDPFDNILIATARSEEYTFITSDPKILDLSVQGLRLHDARK